MNVKQINNKYPIVITDHDYPYSLGLVSRLPIVVACIRTTVVLAIPNCPVPNENSFLHLL